MLLRKNRRFGRGLRLFPMVGLWLAFWLLSGVVLNVQPVPVAHANALVVTTTAPTGPGSLKDAIDKANNEAGSDTITFNLPSYPATIVVHSDFNISDDLSIYGPGTSQLTISGDNTHRLFTVGVTLSLYNLTLTKGNTDNDPYIRGGAIYVAYGTLNINNVVITDSRAVVQNTLDIGEGGAIYNNENSTTNIINSTISGNTSNGGGGIYNRGIMTIVGSTISNNSTTGGNIGGGGLYTTYSRPTIIVNSTFSNNTTTGLGGGIYSYGPIYLLNLTMYGNKAWRGGGFYSDQGSFGIKNTIVAGNIATNAGPDIYGPFTSYGYNLVQNRIDSSGYLNTDLPNGTNPLLGPLQNNGGPTFTYNLAANSPAINAGNPAGCKDQDNNLITIDQRGLGRPQGGRCDIGAVEYGAVVTQIATTTLLTTSANIITFGQTAQLTATVTALSGTPSGNVTFKSGGNEIGRVALLNGVATLQLPPPHAGNLTFTAQYEGDSIYTPSSSQVASLTINRASTATTLTVSPNPAVAGQVVTLKATVTSAAGIVPGAVIFLDGTNSLGAADLVNNEATFTFTSPGIGTHDIKATSIQTDDFYSSNSSIVTLTVNEASTNVTLASMSNAALVGQPVTFTAVVRLTALGSGVSTGSLTFKEGTTTLGTGTLDSYGVATFTTSALSLGSHSITAVYVGAGNFLDSSSSVLNQQIVDVCSGQVINNANDDGAGTSCGTLSYALKQAALKPAASPPFLIGFATSQITLTTPLGAISNTNGVPIVLNGGCAIQNGRGVPQVKLVKGNGADAKALTLGSNATVKGFAITGFSGNAVEIQGNNNTLACNWMGTADGTTAGANGGGVRLIGSNNALGQPGQPESGNLISGNSGVAFQVESGSKNNAAYYNRIGLKSDNSATLKNGSGIKILPGGQLKLGPGNLIRA